MLCVLSTDLLNSNTILHRKMSIIAWQMTKFIIIMHWSWSLLARKMRFTRSLCHINRVSSWLLFSKHKKYALWRQDNWDWLYSKQRLCQFNIAKSWFFISKLRRWCVYARVTNWFFISSQMRCWDMEVISTTGKHEAWRMLAIRADFCFKAKNNIYLIVCSTDF